MSGFNNKKAQKCVIYWDYENCPVPHRASSFGNVHDVMKRKIYKYLQYEVPVEARVYIAAKKIPQKVKEQMDICGAKNIDIPSWKAEAVDKRILVDLALDLYDWKGHNICNAIVLISGDKDFGNILSRIHNAAEIATLILIRLPKDNGLEHPINKNLYSNVDYIVDGNQGNGFKVEEFIDCNYGNKCYKDMGQCAFYHHQQHYQTKMQLQQTQVPQSPASSVSNLSIVSGVYNDEKQIDTKTLAIRKKTPCKFGNKCKNWEKGNCHYLHYKIYQTPCIFGNECKHWKGGYCRYFHAGRYIPVNFTQQPLYEQQVQQPQMMNMFAAQQLAQQQLYQQQLYQQQIQMNNYNANFPQQQQMINPVAVVGGVQTGADINYVIKSKTN